MHPSHRKPTEKHSPIGQRFKLNRVIPSFSANCHCVLATFWSRVLGKNDFHARQVSKRGGDLWLKLEGDRVKIAGHSVAVMQGTISV